MVIPVEATTAITIAAALLAVGGTWKVLGYRLRVVEGQAEKLSTALALYEARQRELDAKLETIRQNQGTRLGELREKIDVVAGELTGFRHGFAVGRRRLRVVKEGDPR